MELIINTKETVLDNLGASLGRTINAAVIAQIMGHDAVAARIITIGLSNILKDAHAGVTYKSFKTEAECLLAKKAKIESTLAALMTGEVRVARESTPSVSQETKVGRSLMLAKLTKEQRKTLASMDDKGVAKLDELAAKHITVEIIAAEVERLRVEAEAKAAVLAALPEIDLGL